METSYMTDSKIKLSFRLFIAVIVTLLKCVVAPIWIAYFLGIAVIPSTKMFFHWIYNNESEFYEAEYRFQQDVMPAVIKYWRITV